MAAQAPQRAPREELVGGQRGSRTCADHLAPVRDRDETSDAIDRRTVVVPIALLAFAGVERDADRKRLSRGPSLRGQRSRSGGRSCEC